MQNIKYKIEKWFRICIQYTSGLMHAKYMPSSSIFQHILCFRLHAPYSPYIQWTILVFFLWIVNMCVPYQTNDNLAMPKKQTQWKIKKQNCTHVIRNISSILTVRTHGHRPPTWEWDIIKGKREKWIEFIAIANAIYNR